jgi:acetolactate decarboxylase
MTALTMTLPPSLDELVRQLAIKRGTSTDSLIASILSRELGSATHRLYQISTAGSLVEGVHEGAIWASELLKHGDFGLGTFQNLNGEMVILEGSIYQVLADGTVKHREDDFKIPFAAVCQFKEEGRFAMGAVASLRELETVCDAYRETQNLFYALRVVGLFDTMRTRAVRAVSAGTSLVRAAKSQREFDFRNVEGTLIGIWSPPYSKAFSVSGYHFHFLSKDRTQGGHVLDCRAAALHVGIQTLWEYDVNLPENGTFLTADLSKDPADALAKAER